MGSFTRAFLAAALVGLCSVTAPACGNKNLQPLEYPSDGVKLTYDLAPGRAWRGHMRSAVTREFQGQPMTNAIECDVVLQVRGPDANRPGTTLLVATFENVTIDSPMPEEFVEGALAGVRGMDVKFNVDATGKVQHMPSLPPNLSRDVGMLIEQLLDVLGGSFFPVPDKTLAMGEEWTDADESGRKGKLGRYSNERVTTEVKGLFRHTARSEDVARLDLSSEKTEVVTTKTGSRETSSFGKKTVLFSTSGNYLASLDGEIRKMDPVAGTTFTKLAVEWTPVPKGTVVPAPEPAPSGHMESQAISDPCNPDYVGTEECVESQAISDPCDPDYVGTESCADGASGTEGAPSDGGTTGAEDAPAADGADAPDRD